MVCKYCINEINANKKHVTKEKLISTKKEMANLVNLLRVKLEGNRMATVPE